MKQLAALSVFIFMSSGFSALAAPAPWPTEIHGPSLADNKDTRIEAKESKGLVVVFLSAKCPCSNSHIKELASLSAEYPEFRFVGVHSNIDEEAGLSKEYFTKISLPFPVIQDDKNHWADQYKALKTPHAFVVSPEGQILYQGGVSSSKDFEKADRKFLREALTDLHSNQKVKTPEGRTLGCVISRGEKNVW